MKVEIRAEASPRHVADYGTGQPGIRANRANRANRTALAALASFLLDTVQRGSRIRSASLVCNARARNA